MNYYDDDENAMSMGFPPGMLPPGMLRGPPRTGGPPRRFDEYYRCYPVAMLPGPERENVNHGGKVIMPPSALDKLTRLHITYPMLFELINGAKETMTHAGVLEFIAEEGKIYLPYWMLGTLHLEPGDLLQIKSTDLPPGQFVKLQPQHPSFLDISDPKAVLENAFRNFACLTIGDIFTFAYNDSVYEIAVKETKPSIAAGGAIGILETDLSVDFEPPVGYVEPEYTTNKKPSGTNTPGGASGVPSGGTLHSQGTMAQAIGYANIAPTSTSAATGARAQSSNFITAGHKLKAPSASKAQAPTPKASTPVAGASTNPVDPPRRKTNGPQPLRLPPGKLFFGYEIKPLREKSGEKEKKEREGEGEGEKKQRFEGQGQTLRGGVKRKGGEGVGEGKEREKGKDEKDAEEEKRKKEKEGGGRTLREAGPR